MLVRLNAAKILVAVIVTFAASCSGNAESAAHHNFTLVGSTACDVAIKSALGIPADLKCDFIRWNLTIDPSKGNAFTLDANYGEAQPNTKGFVSGGLKITATGKFEVSSLSRPPKAPATPPKAGGEFQREVYRLTNDKIDLSLAKLNANLFQLLMPDGSMMIGNGGWSYTLNRKPAVAGAPLPNGLSSSLTRSTHLTFDGRTPCAELATIIPRPADVPDCFKIKWRIILDRDPATLRPSTFTMHTTFNRRDTISGTWSESVVGNAVIYRMLPAEKAKAFSLLAADDALLFFVDDNNIPLVGNEDFSFTLNRLDR